MVQAMIQISEEANHVLNIVKAKFSLKDKSEAIEKVVLDYGEDLLEPELRPEFIEKMLKVHREKPIAFRSMGDFRKRYEMKK